MAAGGLCHSVPGSHLHATTWRRVRFSTWIGLLVTMGTLLDVAETQCSFNGRGLFVSGQAALELRCQCLGPSGDLQTLFTSTPIKIRDASGQLLHHPDLSKSSRKGIPDVEVVANEQSERDTKQGRAKLTLRLLHHHPAAGDITYTCTVKGYNQQGSAVFRNIPLTYVSTTTPTVTTSTTTITTKAMWLPHPTPAKEDTPRVEATAGNTEEEDFSGVGLYVTVGLSCVLLIVIVLALMSFVRVRSRRRRRVKLAQTVEDLESSQQLTTNHNSLNKAAKHERFKAVDKLLPKQTGSSGISPAFHMIGQDDACAVHTCSQPYPTSAEGHGGKGGRGTRLADSLPLLGSQASGSQGSLLSEEDDDDIGRRERHLRDSSRRSRPRDVVPPRSRTRHSRSLGVLNMEESPRMRRLRPHRHYDSSSDEDLPAPGHGRRNRTDYGRPRRSWSQHSLHRRHRYASAGEEDHLEDYPPVWPSSIPHLVHVVPGGHYGDGQFYLLPPTLPLDPADFHQDMELQQSARAQGRRGRQNVEAPPLTVRVQEEHNVVYPHLHPPSLTHHSGNRGRTRRRSQNQGMDDLSGTASGTDTSPPENRTRRAGREVQVDVEVSAAGDSEPPVGRAVQPRPSHDGPYLSDSTPCSKRRRSLSSFQPPRQHDTASTPCQYTATSVSPQYETSSVQRHQYLTSTPRPYVIASSPRHGGQRRVVRHNLSYPELILLSDSGMGVHRAPCSESEDKPRPAQSPARQPPPRAAKKRSRCRSADDHPRHRRWSGERCRKSPESTPKVRHGPQHLHSRDGESPARTNLLSREEGSPSPEPVSPLNVPVRHAQAARRGSQEDPDSTRCKTAAEPPAPPARPGTGREGDGGSTPGTKQAGRADATDSSSECTPPLRHRSSSSSSENDKRPGTSSARQPEAVAEISLRDIKTDYETRRKRPVSFKAANAAHSPVACAADVTERQGGAAHTTGLHKRESARSGRSDSRASRTSRQGERAGEGARPQQWQEELGVQILPSMEHTASSECSQFTEHNHSTSAKTLHPCLE